MNQYKYFAFISYSHKDKRKAKQLQQKLERFIIPSSLRKENPELPKRIRPVFRDVSDLSLGVLTDNIGTALLESQFLIVLCSPASAKSKWVEQEIKTFLSIGEETAEDRLKRIIPIIVDTPEASPIDNQASSTSPLSGPDYRECFPKLLISLSSEKELLAANLFESGREHAVAKVVARMLGIEPDILWKRNRRHKKVVLARAGFIISTIVALTLWGFQTLNNRIQVLQARRIIETARTLIGSHDPMTAQRLLLSIIPEKDPPQRPDYLSTALFLIRKAECTYQNGDRVIPGTFSNGYWEFLNEDQLVSIEGIVDICNGKHTAFPDKIHLGPDYRDHLISYDGNTLFFAEKYRVLKYDIPSKHLSEFFDLSAIPDRPGGWYKYIMSLSLSKDYRLGITFSVGEGEASNGYLDGYMACIVDADNGNLLTSFCYPYFEEGKDETYSFVCMDIDEDKNQAFFMDSDGRTLLYDLIDGELLGESKRPHKFGTNHRITAWGIESPEGRYRAEWSDGQGVILSPKVKTVADPFVLKHSYVRRGDSLDVYDIKGVYLTSAYCPYPVSSTCFDLNVGMIDPQRRRTLFVSQGNGYDHQEDVYIFDWIEKKVFKVNHSFHGGEKLYWSKQGNTLVAISIDELHPYMGYDGSISVIPCSTSAFSTDGSFYSFNGWPVSPDVSYIFDYGIYKADTGELVCPYDSLGTYVAHFLFGLDGFFLYSTEDELKGLDLNSGEKNSYRIIIQDEDFDQISPDRLYLGVLGSSSYSVISLVDGSEVLKESADGPHLLTDSALFSYSNNHLSGWSLSTKNRLFRIRLPAVAQMAIGGNANSMTMTSPDPDYVVLAANGKYCIFDAENGGFVDVLEKQEFDELFSSTPFDCGLDRTLLSIRERYRDNFMTQEELRVLLGD